jgi:hypothetical protein
MVRSILHFVLALSLLMLVPLCCCMFGAAPPDEAEGAEPVPTEAPLPTAAGAEEETPAPAGTPAVTPAVPVPPAEPEEAEDGPATTGAPLPTAAEAEEETPAPAGTPAVTPAVPVPPAEPEEAEVEPATTEAPLPTSAGTEEETPTATPLAPAPPVPAIEERIAEVEWPASMRVGDSDVIRLSLFPVEEGYVAVPEIEGHEVAPTVVPMQVTRPGYTGYVVASLSAAGLEAERAGPAEQLLVPGQPNAWRWTISPDGAGSYRVVVDLSVRWEPEADSGMPGPFEEAVWSRILTVEAHAVLGLSGKQTDWMGVGGSALGVVSSVPFAEKALEAAWKRFKQRRGKGGEAKTKKE